jgi:cell division protein FtsZ
MGGRSVPSRRPTTAVSRAKSATARSEGAMPPARETAAPTVHRNVPVTSTSAATAATASTTNAEARAVHTAKAAQEEFGFGEIESRGHFEKTDRNLFDGQDLDVPTYLRKGIKIAL